MPVSQLVAGILKGRDTAETVFQLVFSPKQYEEFIQAANNGDTMAQYYVGYMYSVGKGVAQNHPKSFLYYLLAANTGHKKSQYVAGQMYEKGTGVPQDYKNALKYYTKAANQGYINALKAIGNLYQHGYGVEKDNKIAMEYFLKGAEKGDISANTAIGIMYNRGLGVTQDYNKAMEYFIIAAKSGKPFANYNIGVLYEHGRGVPRDYSKAMEYYLVAVSKGDEEAKTAVERVKAKILKKGTKTPPPKPYPSLSPAPTSLKPASVSPKPGSASPSPVNLETFLGVKPPPIMPLKTEDWTVEDVVEWIASLNLSQSYRELIRENHLTGKALLTMKTKEDWQELGVTKFGDLRVLVNASITGGYTAPISTSSIPTVANNGTNNRMAQIEGLDDVVYKPIIKLVGGEYRPPRSCYDHVLADLPSVLIGISNIPSIIAECLMVVESRLQHVPSSIPMLSADESLAIALYSYDLGSLDIDKNLYHILNKVMRERDPHKIDKLKPFLSYLMNGLSKLPPLQAMVYRGIPNSSMKLVQDNYRAGVSVHWSGFTSATTNIDKAKHFARTEGIIFRIKVLTGRSIKHYSTIPSEDEVLLSPNIKLLVSSSVQKESDGFHYVELVEQLHSPAFIF